MNSKFAISWAVALLGSTVCWGAAPNGAPAADPATINTRSVENAPGELALRSSYSISKDVLTTEKVWVLDPEELNPHRQRWLLNRKVSLADLKPREIPGAKAAFKYGVMAGGIDAVTTAYFREDGPWFRPLAEFTCSNEPLSGFGTLAGSRVAADVAAKAWDGLLETDRIKLSILLKRVVGVSPGIALEKARLVFDEWLKSVEAVWRAQGRVEAKRAEWKSYFAAANEQGFCGPSAPKKIAGFDDEYVPPAQHAPIPWELMMERPGTGDIGRAGLPFDETKLLARAPAKIWDGLFSVRLNLTIAGHKLNGVFLIDSGSGTSVISPEFLNGQGMLSAWLEIPGAAFRRVPWGGTGAAGSEGGLAPVVSVDLAELGNTPLQIKDFALFDSEFFTQPENPTSCCDGVLGTDFLRHYVVELQPGPPAEVKLWPSENFHLASGDGSVDLENGNTNGAQKIAAQWIETALSPAGEAVSTCTAQPTLNLKAQYKGAGQTTRLVGVRWDSGREDALSVHVPWQKSARAAMGNGSNSWDISCGPGAGESIAHAVPASFPKSDGTPETAAVQAKVPAFTVGMELLSRGRVFLDFPHGRIWFPDKTTDEPIRRDNSGLVLKYEYVKTGKAEHRALVVRAIHPGTLAQALVKRGLKPGMLITQVDKINAEELDARQVSRHLAGVYGDEVYLQWQTPQGLKLGVLKSVRQLVKGSSK